MNNDNHRAPLNFCVFFLWLTSSKLGKRDLLTQQSCSVKYVHVNLHASDCFLRMVRNLIYRPCKSTCFQNEN